MATFFSSVAKDLALVYFYSFASSSVSDWVGFKSGRSI